MNSGKLGLGKATTVALALFCHHAKAPEEVVPVRKGWCAVPLALYRMIIATALRTSVATPARTRNFQSFLDD